MDKFFSCMWCGVRNFFFFCLFIILPIVGLVWWFVLKSPLNFMWTCFGVGILWVGLGIGYYFYRYSNAKSVQLRAEK